ncbi:outer membrane protein assembly factor BamB family protein [Actinotalea fermentans]|uniref:Pyrrolo-quinoline quinone repeat domain-containing protein n=1 Tax=Actinotalea fermentans TaxID=43671 RepID=A0A511YTZ2_9CELL|nr:PQQ-binding-like beta-propeller repeat protein [Actinotalea fermentans]KGM15804.1 hypothetical protein N867_05430 [Actinotalea fermentans ATCC 43279 = JCM 9966 = DSM 3133]GEN78636.1 hypothetical protein AFE02nite_03700 [Actinotalea fermentans]
MAVRPDDRMVPVELVDDDEVVGPSPRTRTPRQRPADPDGADLPVGRAHGALVRWAVAGVVLGAIAVVSVATTRGTTEPTVGPAALAEPLAEVWAAAADDVLAAHDGVVVVQSTGTRHPRVRGLDEATGQELWSVPLGSGGIADTCHPGVTTAAATAAATAWCWRDQHWNADPASDQLVLTPQALVGIDVGSGEVISEREVTEASAGWAVEGDELLLAARGDGEIRLSRVSPAGWRTVWSTTVSLPPEPRGLRHTMWLEVTEGLAVLHGATTAVVDAADGRVLGSWTASLTEEGTILDGAEIAVTPWGFAAWSSAVEGMRLPEATWFDRSGRAVGQLVGELAEPEATDASVPDVLLVTRDGGDTLVAMSPGRGADLWQIPIAGGNVVAREQGLAVVAAGDAVTAYEVLSGARVWTRPVDGLHPEITGLSDGSSVLVTAVRARRWTSLVYRLADGGLLWSGTVPGGGEVGLIPSPPRLEMLGDTPVVWMGRTLVWVD